MTHLGAVKLGLLVLKLTIGWFVVPRVPVPVLMVRAVDLETLLTWWETWERVTDTLRLNLAGGADWREGPVHCGWRRLCCRVAVRLSISG